MNLLALFLALAAFSTFLRAEPDELKNGVYFAAGANADERFETCMSLMQVELGHKGTASIVKAGPSLRALTGQGFRKAAVIGIHRELDRTLLVLKPISDRTLREITGRKTETVEAGNMQFLLLNDAQFAAFQQDSPVLGEVKVHLRESETPTSWRLRLLSHLSVGSVIEIGLDDYVIVHKELEEEWIARDSIRRYFAPKYTLAKFKGALLKGKDTFDIHTLKSDSNLHYKFDGQDIGGFSALRLGTVDVRVHHSGGRVISAQLTGDYQSEGKLSTHVPVVDLSEFKPAEK